MKLNLENSKPQHEANFFSRKPFCVPRPINDLREKEDRKPNPDNIQN